MKISLLELKRANPNWFSKGNKRSFNDISYETRIGKRSRETYLVRSTWMWDGGMFETATPKKIYWMINPIDSTKLKIKNLVEIIFKSKLEVNEWLERN